MVWLAVVFVIDGLGNVLQVGSFPAIDYEQCMRIGAAFVDNYAGPHHAVNTCIDLPAVLGEDA